MYKSSIENEYIHYKWWILNCHVWLPAGMSHSPLENSNSRPLEGVAGQEGGRSPVQEVHVLVKSEDVLLVGGCWWYTYLSEKYESQLG